MLTVKVLRRGSCDLDMVKGILSRLFPAREVYPMWVLLWLAKRRSVRFEAFYDEGELVGFAYYVCYEDSLFILYLAVNDRVQSKGYGSRILSAIKQANQGKTLYLNIESLDEAADNYQQRVRRLRFYQKNGFYESGYQLIDGDKYLVLTTSPSFDAAAFKATLKHFSFGLYSPKLDRIINPNSGLKTNHG